MVEVERAADAEVRLLPVAFQPAEVGGENVRGGRCDVRVEQVGGQVGQVTGYPAADLSGWGERAGLVAHRVGYRGHARLGARPVPGQRAVQHRAHRAHVGVGRGGLVGARVGEHHATVRRDQYRARVQVAVRRPGGVDGRDRAGDRTGHGQRAVGLQRRLGDVLAQ